MTTNRVRASRVLSAKDLKMRTDQDVTDIVSRFLVPLQKAWSLTGSNMPKACCCSSWRPATTGPEPSTSTTANRAASGCWNLRTACSAVIPDERCAGRSETFGCSTSRKTLLD